MNFLVCFPWCFPCNLYNTSIQAGIQPILHILFTFCYSKFVMSWTITHPPLGGIKLMFFVNRVELLVGHTFTVFPRQSGIEKQFWKIFQIIYSYFVSRIAIVITRHCPNFHHFRILFYSVFGSVNSNVLSNWIKDDAFLWNIKWRKPGPYGWVRCVKWIEYYLYPGFRQSNFFS